MTKIVIIIIIMVYSIEIHITIGLLFSNYCGDFKKDVIKMVTMQLLQKYYQSVPNTSNVVCVCLSIWLGMVGQFKVHQKHSGSF